MSAPVPSLRQLAVWVALARVDPTTFIRLCLTDPSGGPLRPGRVHEELQRFLSSHRLAVVELPRDHGKTVQVCGRVLWELGRRPGLRVKVVCATEAVAAQRGQFLRQAIASNPRVRAVFPGLRPGRPWAATAFTVRRPAEVVGPSVAAFGVGAGRTGSRADLLVCDDLVDVRAMRSRAERDRTADYFTNNLLNLLEPDGRCWCLCTPWHPDDLNARLKRNPAFAVFRRPVGPDLEPVWPEQWPTEALRQRLAEIGPAAFARGYRLQPLTEDEALIRPEWVRVWTEPAPAEQVVLAIDPAVSPAPTADRSALVVLGRVTGPDGPHVRVLACTARRVPAPELVALIDAYDRHWHPAVILFEANAAFRGLKDLLTRHAAFGPRVQGVVQTTDKSARAAALGVVVANGALRLKGDGRGGIDPAQHDLFTELTGFPHAEHDDLLDATAAGCAYLLNRREPRAW